jgi:hypothetical protein
VPVRGRPRLTYRRLFRSEFLKLRSHSAVKLLLLFATAGAVLFSTFSAAGRATSTAYVPDRLPRVAESNIVNAAIAGMGMIQVLIVICGVLVAASEFDAKTAAITFMSVPRRYPLVVVRSVLMAVIAFVAGLIIVLCGSAVAFPGLLASGLELRFWSPHVLVPFLGAAVFLALSAVLGVCVGTLLRSALGGIIAAIALVSVLPSVVMIVDHALDLRTVGFAGFLPSPFTGSGLYMYVDHEHGPNEISPPPAAAIAVFLGWIAAIGALALWRLRRDVV